MPGRFFRRGVCLVVCGGAERVNHPQIFISYSRDDADIVNRLKGALAWVGIDVLVAGEGLTPGTPGWIQRVPTIINQATLVIYCASETAARSPFVLHELGVASGAGKRILLFWIRGAMWRDCVPAGWEAATPLDGRDARFDSAVAELLRLLGINAPLSTTQGIAGATPAQPIAAHHPRAVSPWPTKTQSTTQSAELLAAASNPEAPDAPDAPDAPVRKASKVSRRAVVIGAAAIAVGAGIAGERLWSTHHIRQALTSASTPTATSLPSTPGTVRWNRKDAVLLIVSDGVAYALDYLGSHNSVYALESATGKQRWTFPMGGVEVILSAVIGEVFFISVNSGYFYALNVHTGAESWHLYTPGSIVDNGFAISGSVTSFVAADGIIYVTLGNGSVGAFDATTGAQRWRYQFYPIDDWQASVTMYTIESGMVYAGYTGPDGRTGHVYALDANTGAKRWSHQVNAIVDGIQLGANGTLVATLSTGEIYAIDATTGAERWSYQAGESRPIGDPTAVVANNIILIGSPTGGIVALDATTGAHFWSYPTKEGVTGLVAHDNKVYGSTEDGHIYALDATTGSHSWSYYDYADRGCWTPILANRNVYAIYYTGNQSLIYSLDAVTGALHRRDLLVHESYNDWSLIAVDSGFIYVSGGSQGNLPDAHIYILNA